MTTKVNDNGLEFRSGKPTSINGATTIAVNSSSSALTVTQTGSGNALVVEDSNSPDSTPFVVDTAGNVGIGTGTPTQKLQIVGNVSLSASSARILGDFSNATVVNRVLFQSSTTDGQTLIGAIPNGVSVVSGSRYYSGTDVANASFIGYTMTGGTDARIESSRNGTGTFLPMTFYTGGSERLRIDTTGRTDLTANNTSRTLNLTTSNTGSYASISINSTTTGTSSSVINNFCSNALTTSAGFVNFPDVTSGVTNTYSGFRNTSYTTAASFTLSNYNHFYAVHGALGASSAITNLFGFRVDSSLTVASNNYGFYSNIAAASGRWNFYANGTAANYFAGVTSFGSALRETRVAMAANDIDCTLAAIYTKTISGTTTLTVSNVPATGTVTSFILELTNGGSATVNWWSGVKWANGTAPSLTAAGIDILSFYTHDGGTTWRGTMVAKDSK